MTRTHKQNFSTNILANGFNHFLHFNGAFCTATDKLLHFIKHNQSQGKLAILCQGLTNCLEHVVTRNILNIGIEIVQGFHAGFWRSKKFGLGLH